MTLILYFLIGGSAAFIGILLSGVLAIRGANRWLAGLPTQADIGSHRHRVTRMAKLLAVVGMLLFVAMPILAGLLYVKGTVVPEWMEIVGLLTWGGLVAGLILMLAAVTHYLEMLTSAYPTIAE